MITLHLAPHTIALASHAALEESGIPHDLVWIDFAAGEQRGEAYRRLNPKGRVPTLVTEDGVLTETPAILEWIADQAPGASLMPDTPWARARVREAMAWLAATVHVNHAHKMRGARWTDDTAAHAALTAHVPTTMTASAREIETLLGQSSGPWLFGSFSVADLHLHAITRWLPGDGVTLDDFPRLTAHAKATAERPAVQRVILAHG